MKLSRQAIQRMISGQTGSSVVINTGGSSGEGGGGGGTPVTLGPLLTSLNGEAMPSAEGYLHWSGSAWVWDTPTGGDPVDLTPYAEKTWVSLNFISQNDASSFLTRTQADGLYAALSHTHPYLPLSAGSSHPLTGSLYITGNSGITWVGGIGMMACQPTSGWTGISATQWGVGALSSQGVIRSNAKNLVHYRLDTAYDIWDAYNFDPSDYLPLSGGTVEYLNVTDGLDAYSITAGSIINSNTMAEYLDQSAIETLLSSWNASSATKLKTARTLWGQNFDGTANVSGAISNTGSITPSTSNAYNIGGRSNYYNTVFAKYLCIVDNITNEDFNIRWWPADRASGVEGYVALYAYETQLGDICIGSTDPISSLYYDASDNKWGLGTATPAEKLDVLGKVKAYGATLAAAESGRASLSVDGTTTTNNLTVGSVANGGTTTLNGNVTIGRTGVAETIVINGYDVQVNARDIYINNGSTNVKLARTSDLRNYATQSWVTQQNYLTVAALPVASASTAGVVKVGTNLSISNGVLSATNTTYQNREAVSGGTQVSLVTTGEKYIWNNKQDAITSSTSLTLSSLSVTGSIGASSANFNSLSVGNQTVATQSWADGRYLPLSGGTVEYLNVTDGLDAYSITAGSIINSNTMAEYLDQSAIETLLSSWNASSATKLKTARTLWGQNFDGTANVSGAISNTGSITPSTSNAYNIGGRSNYYNTVFAKYLCIVDNITNEDFNIRWWPADRASGVEGYVALYAYETQLGDICIGSTDPISSLYYDASDNKWGLGTATPAEKLDVLGKVKAYGATLAAAESGRASLSVDGTTTTNNLTVGSVANGGTTTLNGNVTIGRTGAAETIVINGYDVQVNARDIYINNGSTNVKLARMSNLSDYLPLAAGSGNPLTGPLTIKNNGGLTIVDPQLTHDFTALWATYNSKDIFAMYAYETKYWDMSLGTHPNAVTSGGLYFDGTNFRWGIGTTTPSAKLDVVGNVAAKHTAGEVLVLDSTASYTCTHYKVGGTSEWSVGADSGKFYFYSNNGSAIRMSLLDTGNVGIGTTSPAAKLHVVGDARITSHLDVDNDIILLEGMGITFDTDSVIRHGYSTGSDSFDGLIIGGKEGISFRYGQPLEEIMRVVGNGVNITGKLDVSNDIVLSGGSTTLFFGGSAGDDPAIYMSNGHIYARAGGGYTVQLV